MSRYNFFSLNSLDNEAQRFLTAAAITNTTQVYAVNKLFTDFKGGGIYTKTDVAGLIVGGTASTHKWNAFDPRDLDAAHRNVQVGTVTNSSTGILGDGVTGYTDMKITPADLTANNWRMGFYCRTNNTTAGRDIGSEQLRVFLYFFGPVTRAQAMSATTSNTTPVANINGWWVLNRTSNTAWQLLRNNVVVDSGSDNSDTSNYMTEAMCLGTNLFAGVPQQPTNREYCTYIIGKSLNSTELTAEYNAIQAFNTTLSRQV